MNEVRKELRPHETKEKIDGTKEAFEFELKIDKLVLKRLIDHGYKWFALTREKYGLSIYDDLVTVYEDKGGVRKHSLFQIKHKKSETDKICLEDLAFPDEQNNDPFLLQKYYDCYLEFVENTDDRHLSGSALDKLVICTNIGFEQDLKGIQLSEVDDFSLLKYSGKLYQLSISNELKKIIFEKSFIPEEKKLAEELVQYLMFQKDINIHKLVNDQHVSFIKKYHEPLKAFVLDVEKKRFHASFFLSDDAQLDNLRNCLIKAFEDFRTHFLSKSRAEQMKILKIESENSVKYFEKNYEQLKSLDLKTISKEMKIKEKIAIFVKAVFDEDLSPESVINNLRSLPFSITKGFGDLSQYSKGVSYFKFKDIDKTNISRKIDTFMSHIIFAVEQNNSDSILSKELAELYTNFNEKMRKWYDQGLIRKGKSILRDWIEKSQIISDARKYEVKFQGKDVKLGELIQDEDHYTPQILMHIYCSQDIRIGETILGLNNEQKKYYLSRTLKRKIILPKVLKDVSQDLFVISNVQRTQNKDLLMESIDDDTLTIDLTDETTLKNREKDWSLSRVILVLNEINEQTFETFIRVNSQTLGKRNVHWLKYNEKGLISKTTHGNLHFLRRYFHDEEHFVRESEMEGEGKFVVICGEPGMGKTTLLLNLPQYFKNHPTIWIITISLKDCLQYLQDKTFSDINDVVEFLSAFENNSRISKELLTIFLKDERRVVLYLDGFDELFYDDNERKQEKILKLLRVIKTKLPVRQVIISTRFKEKECLESALGVLHISLKELTVSEQVSFLTRYCSSNGDSAEMTKLEINARNLVQKCNKNINSQEKSFLGIPLQTFMFAEAFKEEIQKDNPKIPDIFHVNDLLEQFMEKKYKIYFNKMREASGMRKWVKDVNRSHVDLAILNGGSLSVGEVNKIPHTKIEYSKDDGIFDAGIVHVHKGNVQFVHRAFSEFLIAKKLVELVDEDYEKYKEVIESILTRDSNRFLLFMFDHKLTGKKNPEDKKERFPFHNFVLCGEIAFIENIDDVNVVDGIGRCFLYYSIQYNHSDITNALIDKQINLNLIEKFLKITLIKHIEMYYNPETICYTSDFRKLVSDHEKLARYLSEFSGIVEVVKVVTDSYKPNLKTQLEYWHIIFEAGKKKYNSDSLRLIIEKHDYKLPFDVYIGINSTFASFLEKENRNLKKDAESIIETLKPLLTGEINLDNSIFLLVILKMSLFKRRYKAMILYNRINAESTAIRARCFEKFRNLMYLSPTNYIPLNMLCSNYYETKYISQAICLPSEVVNLIKVRAENMATVSKLLLEVGAQVERNLSMTTYSVSDRFIEFEGSHYLYKFNEGKSITAIKLQLDKQEPSGKRARFARDFIKVFEDYERTLNLDDQMTFRDVMCKILDHELNRSKAWTIINHTKMLHSSIMNNEIDSVSTQLLGNINRQWLKAVLNACNEDFETSLDIAKKNGFQQIVHLIERLQNKISMGNH